ncbi:MAG: efflux RND transporter periplasmic adaptor subunit [Victivallaceae bacterium]
MKFVYKLLKWCVLLVVVLAAAYFVYRQFSTVKSQVTYSTAKTTRGDLKSVISATGTVEPEELVNVGAQVGGMVTTLGTDTEGRQVDYCSRVTAGTVLARIDDALYAASVKSAEAQVAQCEAQVANARANLAVSQAKLELADANWKRAEKLGPKSVIAGSDYDSAKADYASGVADISVKQAALKQADAQLKAAQANLERDQWNLKYCVVTSPVDGVIIDRRVNVGQTVNSSMSAPSLFLIAKDLKRMEVWVSVNEADIGSIRPGQEVEFTVDSFPGRVFAGSVNKIRLNATMSQNVVTFVTEVVTDNSDGTLMPYLTANVDFILARRKGVLHVPNGALRFTPDVSLVPEKYHSLELKDGERLLWTLEDGRLKPLVVTTGLNDGTNTEIVSGLGEGVDVVIGATTVSSDTPAAEANAGSPFLPKMPRPGWSKKK